VLDVAVDIRVGSSTFGQHVAVELSGENKRQIFVPRSFAHGFVALSYTATFAYKVDITIPLSVTVVLHLMMNS
jgi:dTDP-4-dehydrorhamnose 3,5-epimerase